MDIYDHYLILDALVEEYERHCDKLVELFGQDNGLVEELHAQAEAQTQHIKHSRAVTLQKIKGIHHS